MIRQRALQVALILFGLLMLVGLYPVIVWKPDLACEQMLGIVYATLGAFLLIAARNPSAHRSLIAFTAWSSLTHGTLMAVQIYKHTTPDHGYLAAVVPFYVIAIVLLALVPAKVPAAAN
jgi:hypothetical protein